MRPILAIVPLALLLAWFGPSPSGESDASGSLGMSQGKVPQGPEAGFPEPLAQAWASIQRVGFLQATSEVAQRR